MRQNHIVKKLILDLQFNTTQYSKQLEQEIVGIYRNRIEATLDEHFDTLGELDMVYQFDTLELDLGSLEPGDLQKEMPLRAASELKKKLNGRSAATANIINESEKKLSLFGHFIETGRLPWWGDKTHKQALEQLVEKLVVEEPVALKQMLSKVIKDEHKTLRLIKQFSDRCLADLGRLYVSKRDIISIADQYDDMSAVLRQLCKRGEVDSTDHLHTFDISHVDNAKLRQYYWHNVLSSLISGFCTVDKQKRLLQDAVASLAVNTGKQYKTLVCRLSKFTKQLQQKNYYFTSKFPQHIAVLSAEAESSSASDPAASAVSQKDGVKARVPTDNIAVGTGAFARARLAVESVRRELAKVRANGIEEDSEEGFIHAQEVFEAAYDGLSRLDTEPLQGEEVEKFARARLAVESVRRELAKVRANRIEEDSAEDSTQAREIIEPRSDEVSRLDVDFHQQEQTEDFTHAREMIDAAYDALSRLDIDLLQQEQTEKFSHAREAIEVARSEFTKLDDGDDVEGAVAVSEYVTEPEQLDQIHRILKNDSPLTDPFTDSEEIYIDNSGLVLLWQYLPRLFNKLGMLAGNNFVDSDASEHAVLLLQYLVEPATEISEVLLPLNKLLCGIPLSQSLPAEIKLTEAEKTECNNLLIAMTTHWQVLEKMTLDRVRVDFLQRLGILRSRDSGWDLHVESQTHDILMQKMPWSINNIKLPWMESVIYVHWDS